MKRVHVLAMGGVLIAALGIVGCLYAEANDEPSRGAPKNYAEPKNGAEIKVVQVGSLAETDGGSGPTLEPESVAAPSAPELPGDASGDAGGALDPVSHAADLELSFQQAAGLPAPHKAAREHEIRSAFDSPSVSGIVVNEVTCRETVCKLVVMGVDNQALEASLQHAFLFAKPPLKYGFTIPVREVQPDGSVRGAIYVHISAHVDSP